MATTSLITFAAYLLGSIPFGYLLVRVVRGEDIRRSGSGNIGATNVSRSSPLLGLLTLLLDGLKGVAAVLLARIFAPGEANLAASAALFAVLGHMFPFWLGFRGGKGVATGLGSFVLLAPKAVLVAVAVFVAVVALFRQVSLGSIVAVTLFPVLAWLLGGQISSFMLGAMTVGSILIVARHHENIRRLLAGTENRFEWRRR